MSVYTDFMKADGFYHCYDGKDLSDELSENFVESLELKKIKVKFESMNPELEWHNYNQKFGYKDSNIFESFLKESYA
jgi:hypothetical protein